eukprot:1136609-Pleurochrysis_carterae.AAC.2
MEEEENGLTGESRRYVYEGLSSNESVSERGMPQNAYSTCRSVCQGHKRLLARSAVCTLTLT